MCPTPSHSFSTYDLMRTYSGCGEAGSGASACLTLAFVFNRDPVDFSFSCPDPEQRLSFTPIIKLSLIGAQNIASRNRRIHAIRASPTSLEPERRLRREQSYQSLPPPHQLPERGCRHKKEDRQYPERAELDADYPVKGHFCMPIFPYAYRAPSSSRWYPCPGPSHKARLLCGINPNNPPIYKHVTVTCMLANSLCIS